MPCKKLRQLVRPTLLLARCTGTRRGRKPEPAESYLNLNSKPLEEFRVQILHDLSEPVVVEYPVWSPEPAATRSSLINLHDGN